MKGIISMFLSKPPESSPLKEAVNRNAEAKRTLMHKASRAETAFDALAHSLNKGVKQ